jgi:hypothetical protein
MAHPTVIHLLALLISCTKGDDFDLIELVDYICYGKAFNRSEFLNYTGYGEGFTLAEALNSSGYVRCNFNVFQNISLKIP